jgi:hypothetical protein
LYELIRAFKIEILGKYFGNNEGIETVYIARKLMSSCITLKGFAGMVFASFI